MHSDWKEVSSGLPQGSILGPVLFSIFINDLDRNLMNEVLKFVDDTKVWGRVDSVEDVSKMQEDLNRLGLWSEKTIMPFNVSKCKISKCKIMYLENRNQKAEYKSLGQRILETNEEKD